MKRKKKILLYYPRLNRTKEERDYHWFPYSILPLAESLSRNFYEPIVIDRRVDNDPFRELRGFSQEILFVGISSMSGYQILDGLTIAKKIRETIPETPIIWGGWHPTILPEETAAHPLVDIAVAGRGEETINEIANAIEDGKGFGHINGTAYKDKQTVAFTGYKVPSKLKDNALDYQKFLSVNDYLNPKSRALGYFSAHGCVHQCAFCSRHFMTNKYSPYPVETVIGDLKYFIHKYGFKHIHFQDDEFFIDVKRTLRLAEALLTLYPDISWWANMRSNFIYRLTKKEVDLLVQSGLNSVFIGVESASRELLETMNKETSPDDIIRTNEVLKKYDIRLNLSYMFGLPGDNADKLRLTINQIKLLRQANKKVNVQTCFYQPYPGTALYQKAINWGFPRLRGLEAWGNLKPQTEPYKFPWLSVKEMSLYEKEFYAAFSTKQNC